MSAAATAAVHGLFDGCGCLLLLKAALAAILSHILFCHVGPHLQFCEDCMIAWPQSSSMAALPWCPQNACALCNNLLCRMARGFGCRMPTCSHHETNPTTSSEKGFRAYLLLQQKMILSRPMPWHACSRYATDLAKSSACNGECLFTKIEALEQSVMPGPTAQWPVAYGCSSACTVSDNLISAPVHEQRCQQQAL